MGTARYKFGNEGGEVIGDTEEGQSLDFILTIGEF